MADRLRVVTIHAAYYGYKSLRLEKLMDATKDFSDLRELALIGHSNENWSGDLPRIASLIATSIPHSHLVTCRLGTLPLDQSILRALKTLQNVERLELGVDWTASPKFCGEWLVEFKALRKLRILTVAEIGYPRSSEGSKLNLKGLTTILDSCPNLTTLATTRSLMDYSVLRDLPKNRKGILKFLEPYSYPNNIS